jgi:hypothetical protein
MCSYTDDIGSFELYWDFRADDRIRFQFSLPGAGWVAFGIGDSMKNSDMVLVRLHTCRIMHSLIC